MTVEELRERIADEFAALSGDSSLVENPVVLEKLLKEAENYVRAYFHEGGEEIESIVIPLFVMERLLERKGYGQLAEQYWNRLVNEVARLMDRGKATDRIAVHSKERIFTEEEMKRW